MRSRALDTVAVVDSSLACFRIDIKPLEVVVEVDGTSAQVAAQQGGVSCEDGRHIDPALLAQGECDTRKPFVEMRDDGLLLLMAYKLDMVST